ncbi:DUF933 domain-containing protein [Micromonospora sp. U56]|nr:DUF933 domain-containing protein [Micromonospora sp. U56]
MTRQSAGLRRAHRSPHPWTPDQVGATAPEAAGIIRSDFQRGFIKAEVVSYADLVQARAMVRRLSRRTDGTAMAGASSRLRQCLPSCCSCAS